MPSTVTTKTVGSSTFTRLKAWTTKRFKDDAPQRFDEIHTLCRQLSRKTNASYVPHFSGGMVTITIDGVYSKPMAEDGMVAELRKQLHITMR